MHKFCVVPYLPADGVPPFRDSVILGLWDKLVEQKLHDLVFFDGNVNTREKFLLFMKNPCRVLFVVESAECGVSGFFWIDNIVHRRAHVHICAFKETWGENAKAMALAGLQAVFNMVDRTGTPVINVLCGVIPTTNPRAIRFAKSVGFSLCGTVPGYLYHAGRGQNVDAAFLTKTL